MTTVRLERRQLATLTRLLTTSTDKEVEVLLYDALAWLIEFWPAQAGALLYVAPNGESFDQTHGQISTTASSTIERSRGTFQRGNDASFGRYTLEGGSTLLELPLYSSVETVGLLHLVTDVGVNGAEIDKETIMLVLQAIGAEADKLSLLRKAEHDLRELNLLYRIGQDLTANLDLDQLLDSIQRYTPEVIGADRCTIMLLDSQTNELVFESPRADGSWQEVRFPGDRGIAGWVATHGEGQIVNNVHEDKRWYNAVQRQTSFLTRSIVCAPMKVRERVVGVIQVLNKTSGDPFTDQDLRLLNTLATQAAIAIENANLYHSLKEERDRLLNKEEEVRHMIARELHDGPTQSVAAIAMNIEYTKRLFQIMPDQVPAELDNLLELAKKTSHDIRTLLFELRPLVLETKGLLGALEQYVTRFRDPSGIRLRLDAPEMLPSISREAEAAAFMIIQEAVNNARKYAGPVEVRISFRTQGDRIIASVRDSGKGFDLAATQSNYSTRGSLGLLNMQERARLIGAEFEMRSAVGQGTEVELRIPITQQPH